MFAPMDFIPNPFMNNIDYCARDIGKKHHSQSQIITAGNKINNDTVSNQYHKPECNCFDDRPVEKFVKPSCHKYTIADGRQVVL